MWMKTTGEQLGGGAGSVTGKPCARAQEDMKAQDDGHSHLLTAQTYGMSETEGNLESLRRQPLRRK